jgi:predicted NUDIX family NTP pyrophosphohydrolase
MEWPPRSGKRQFFPEADRGGWFTIENAREKMLIGQRPMLDAFLEKQARKKTAPG